MSRCPRRSSEHSNGEARVTILLDTHVFLWLNAEPERLGDQLERVENVENELLVSAASAWEIAIKYALGKLRLPEKPRDYVPERIHALGGHELPIECSHALAAAALEPLHRDPFDRMLVAQAIELSIPIMTADPAVAQYPVETMLVTR
jgi:PIN domain nuclease of toxin-antitoxin system